MASRANAADRIVLALLAVLLLGGGVLGLLLGFGAFRSARARAGVLPGSVDDLAPAARGCPGRSATPASCPHWCGCGGCSRS
jgi:hypothetical protein